MRNLVAAKEAGRSEFPSLPVFVFFVLTLLGSPAVWAQIGEVEKQHTRGRLWENIVNDGMIGNLGAWDFLTPAPLGMFPGFPGFTHPVGGEENAINTFSNANFHNFRSGIWIAVKDMMIPDTPPDFRPVPTDFELFISGGAGDTFGAESDRAPLRLQQNFIESPDFNPLLPEEMTESWWHTSTGITVTRRSYVWSYPGYRDFIIYDYIFKHTGQVVSTLTQEVVPDFPQQTLNDVYFAFVSGISVSTKSQINFHSDLVAVQAGAFGWQPESYHDFYHVYDDETLVFSKNFNGGKEPPPFDPYNLKEGEVWKQKFGEELQSPAAFGWLALHASAADGAPRQSPRPDVLRIDSHKGGTFQGQDLDLEFFRLSANVPKKRFYDYVSTPGIPATPENGKRFNFYTLSYGPYDLQPGDSLRFILAEIAGVMDYHTVIAGDPEGHFPDSTIAAIRRNAQLARDAVAWGVGAIVDGMPLAADAPEPPPGPTTDAVNASVGRDTAAIAVTWDRRAEDAVITDGSSGVFYDGATDLDGYRIYRSTDFQYTSDTEAPVLRGAAWDLLVEVPKSEFGDYWDEELGRYRYVDGTVNFGFRYGYYVSAYNENPGAWTSANGTVVNDLPELASGSQNRTPAVSAASGPVSSFDVYAVPNPYVFNDPERNFGLSDPFRIEFRNLPERATIRIYTISGDLIRTIRHGPDQRGNLFGSTAWDQKTDSGLLVAPGLYIYHIKSETEGLGKALTGKLMIVR